MIIFFNVLGLLLFSFASGAFREIIQGQEVTGIIKESESILVITNEGSVAKVGFNGVSVQKDGIFKEKSNFRQNAWLKSNNGFYIFSGLLDNNLIIDTFTYYFEQTVPRTIMKQINEDYIFMLNLSDGNILLCLLNQKKIKIMKLKIQQDGTIKTLKTKNEIESDNIYISCIELDSQLLCQYAFQSCQYKVVLMSLNLEIKKYIEVFHASSSGCGCNKIVQIKEKNIALLTRDTKDVIIQFATFENNELKDIVQSQKIECEDNYQTIAAERLIEDEIVLACKNQNKIMFSLIKINSYNPIQSDVQTISIGVERSINLLKISVLGDFYFLFNSNDFETNYLIVGYIYCQSKEYTYFINSDNTIQFRDFYSRDVSEVIRTTFTKLPTEGYITQSTGEKVEINTFYEASSFVYHSSSNPGTYTLEYAGVYNEKIGEKCTITLKVNACFESCLKCTELGNSEDNKCIECKPGYIHSNSLNNCEEICQFNYYFDKIGKYICTPDNTCDTATNKNYVFEKQCVSECPENFFAYDKKCLKNCPSDTDKDENLKICLKNIKDIQPKDVEEIIKKIKEKLKDSPSGGIVKSNGIIGQMYSTSDTSNLSKEASYVDLGECEAKLRKFYSYIKPEEPLYMITVDLISKESETNVVEYKVFDSKGTELDLIHCKDEKVNILYVTNNVNLTQAEEMEGKGIDIYNPEHPFFNDICFPYSVNGADVLLNDRRNEIYENVSFCETGCKYNYIDYKTKKVNCSCLVKSSIDSVTTDSEERKKDNKFLNGLVPVNIFVVKCAKKFLSFSNLKNNVGFFFSLILADIQAVVFVFFVREYKNWKRKVANAILELKANPSCKRNRHSLNMSETKDEIDVPEFIRKSNKKNSIISKSSEKVWQNYFQNSFDRTSSNSTFCRRSVVKKGSAKKILPTLSEELPSENDFGKGFSFFKKLDIDLFPYPIAKEKDKRNCFNMFCKILKEKHMLLRAIFAKSSFEIITIHLSVYISYLGLYFTLNALLYTDDLISERYRTKNELSFFQNIIKSSCSCLVSVILLSIIRFSGKFTMILETYIQEIKITKDFIRLSEKLIKKVKFNLIIFFTLEIILSLFYLYYLSCFCIVYHSTQMSWFKGGWISFGISFFVCIFICFFFSLFRYIAIACRSKNLYNIQLFINQVY